MDWPNSTMMSRAVASCAQAPINMMISSFTECMNPSLGSQVCFGWKYDLLQPRPQGPIVRMGPATGRLSPQLKLATGLKARGDVSNGVKGVTFECQLSARLAASLRERPIWVHGGERPFVP